MFIKYIVNLVCIYTSNLNPTLIEKGYSISVVMYKGCRIAFDVGVRIFLVVANENCCIWWFEFVFDLEWTKSVKCVIEFDMVCESFRGLMQMLERGHYFQCLAEYKIGCSKPEDCIFNFFCMPMGLLDVVVWIYWPCKDIVFRV